MTIHSDVEYKCKYCDTRFVPIPEVPYCPRCFRNSDTVFPDFVKNTIKSAQFNLSAYGMFVKMWMQMDIGDFYYSMAFHFLKYVCSELKEDKYHLLSRSFSHTEAYSLARQFLNQLNYEEGAAYWRHGLRTYLSLLLQEESNKAETVSRAQSALNRGKSP